MTWHLGWSWGMLGLGLGDKCDLWSSFIMVRETLSFTGFVRCAQWELNVSASTQRYFNLFHRLTWSLVRSIADLLLCICKTLHHRLLWLISGLTGDTESEPRTRNVIGCWVVGPSWFLSKKFQARSEWTPKILQRKRTFFLVKFVPDPEINSPFLYSFHKATDKVYEFTDVVCRRM